MDGFEGALLSAERSSLIPEEFDYFRELIGSWKLDYVEERGTDRERHLAGEWHFARILEGLGIEDVFVCPERAIRKDPEDGEYGVTIRIYNVKTKMWDMIYACLGSISRFTGTRKDHSVIFTNNGNQKNRWIFTDITADSFCWRNETTLQDGTVKVWCEVFATRA